MSRRAVFLDFDGTYADRSEVPDAHKDVVARSRAAGNVVLLCTGRPLAFVPDYDREPFDGLICSGGAYVQVGDRVIEDHRFPRELAQRTLSVLIKHDVLFIAESPDHVVAPRTFEPVLDHFNHRLGFTDEHPASVTLVDDFSQVSLSKIVVYSSPVPLADLVAEIGEGVDWVAASIPGARADGGEIFQTGFTKATGMVVACSVLGIEPSQTVGIGDGANDLSMLEWAHTAVAIEGAPAELISHADLLAAPPSRAGLVDVFNELGLC